jgi:hypothetical protein
VRKKRKEKKRKEKDQGRREGGSSEGKVPVPYTKNSFFLVHKYLGLEAASSPSWLKYRLLRDLVYEEAMCKGSSGNGLLYAAKAVP